MNRRQKSRSTTTSVVRIFLILGAISVLSVKCAGDVTSYDDVHCGVPEAYTASTLDILQFVEAKTYRNITGGVTFMKHVKEDGWMYTDYNIGKLYVSYIPGFCTVTEIEDWQITVEQAYERAIHLFAMGDHSSAFSFTAGDLSFEVLMDNVTCVPTLFKATYKNELKTANYNFDFITENPDLRPLRDIQPVLKDCIEVAS